MPVVHKELLKTVRQVTRGGSTWEITLECMVSELDPSEHAEGEKFLTTDDADIELRSAGFTPGSACPEHANLVLSDVELEMVDRTTCRAYLRYVHRSEYDYQNLSSPPGGKLWFNTEAGLAEVESEVDKNDAAIAITYIYPTGDQWFDPKRDKNEAARTRIQGGRVQVKIPTKVATLRGTLQTNWPDDVINAILGKVNTGTWRGGDLETWLCTQANYTLFNDETTVPSWLFDFRFEYNPDGWQPRAVAVHEGTGKIPGDWKSQNAYAKVDWYDSANYNTLFSGWGVNEVDV